MGRETSTAKKHVYTGHGAIRTEDGLRSNIDAGNDDSLPFVASVGWLQRHFPVRHLLKTLVAYEAEQAAKVPAPQPTPEKVEKVAKAPRKRARKAPKSEE